MDSSSLILQLKHVCIYIYIYLTIIIPRAPMGSESIAHWGSRNNIIVKYTYIRVCVCVCVCVYTCIHYLQPISLTHITASSQLASDSSTGGALHWHHGDQGVCPVQAWIHQAFPPFTAQVAFITVRIIRTKINCFNLQFKYMNFVHSFQQFGVICRNRLKYNYNKLFSSSM